MIEMAQNESLRIRATNHGAELVNVQKLPGGPEYLWQRDPMTWNRQAPILFPIVGRLRNDRYRLGNREYEMPSHGFAQEFPFALVEKGDERLVYELRESEATLRMYPFRFACVVEYRLDRATLAVGYSVVNRGDETMLFSIGGHPGFRCPLQAGESFGDYYLEFEHKETATRYYLEDGLVARSQERFLNDESIIRLTPELFKARALVFKNLKSLRVTLKSDTANSSTCGGRR